jgi:hypothetical protein
MVQSFSEWANSQDRVDIFEHKDNPFRNEHRLFGNDEYLFERHYKMFEARNDLFEQQFYNIPKLNESALNESWDLLDNESLKRLDEHDFTPALSRDAFFAEAFPLLNECFKAIESDEELNESLNESYYQERGEVLNENFLDYAKDFYYALYESQLFATHKKHWFERAPKRGIIPIMLETDTHNIICYDTEAFAISKKSYELMMSGRLNEEEERAWYDKLADGVKKLAVDAYGVGKDIVNGAVDLGAEAIDGAVKIATTVYNWVEGAIVDSGEWLAKAGKTIWDGLENAYNNPGAVINGAIDTLGDWAKSIGDAAKSVVGFIGSAYQAVKAFIGTVDWLTMVNTLSTIFRALLGTVGVFVSGGLLNTAGAVLLGVTGLMGLYVGYERIAKPIEKIGPEFKAAKTEKELGLSVCKMAPGILSGCTAMLVGARDLIKMGSAASPLAGITAISELFAGESEKKINGTAVGIFKEQNAEGIGAVLSYLGLSPSGGGSVKENQQILEAKKNKAKAKAKAESPAKDDSGFEQIALMGSCITVEYLLPGDMKSSIKTTIPTVAKGIEGALGLPKKAKEFFTGVGKEGKKKEGGLAGKLVTSALGIVAVPICSCLETFCDGVKSVSSVATTPLIKMPKVIDDTIKLVEEKIEGVAKSEIVIPVMKEVEHKVEKLRIKTEDTKVLKKEFAKYSKESSKEVKSSQKKAADDKKKTAADKKKAEDKGKKSSKGKKVSESNCINFETWVTLNS